MEFRDMLETSEIFMPLIMKEKPDLVVGLFHSGWDDPGDDAQQGSHYDENGVYSIAMNVPGFDVILCGHNHNVVNTTLVNTAGDTVLILEGGSKSEKLARADAIFTKSRKDGRYRRIINGRIIDVEKYSSDNEFIRKFAGNRSAVSKYVDKQIAVFETTVTSRDSYFGPSPFVDLIHTIQINISGADISFAAPLSFDVKISAGPVTVGDMFKLYRYENMLYVMSLTGSEIRKYLEFSYSDWFNTMKFPDGHLLKFRVDRDGEPILTNGKAWLRNQPYNFDSAVGIDYNVDVSRPAGERVSIIKFSNGKKFDMKETYSVALNSYRGNGGGGHLTAGAGIPKSELAERLIKSTDRDLRYYILKYLEDKGRVEPVASNNWAIVPESLIKNARSRDYELLFGK
jgi:2',3'-cyclic-nucleotide 2'-phosphodiesterase/3'-nucleotidase